MARKPTYEELEQRVKELEQEALKREKAEKLMDSMNKKRNQELEALSGNTKQIQDFLIQIMDDSGQIGEKCFGIKCVADKEKKFSNPY